MKQMTKNQSGCVYRFSVNGNENNHNNVNVLGKEKSNKMVPLRYKKNIKPNVDSDSFVGR